MEEKFDEINLTNYARVIYKGRKTIAIFFIVLLILAVTYSYFITSKIYSAKVLLQVGTTEEVWGKISLIEEIPQLVQKIKSGLYGSGANAMAIEGTNLIVIDVRGTNKEEINKSAEEIANKVISQQNEEMDRKKADINSQIQDYQKFSDDLKKDYSYLLARNQQVGDIKLRIYDFYFSQKNLEIQLKGFQPTKIVEEANVSQKPVSPKPFLNLIVAGISGILLGCVWVFLKEWWGKNKKEIKLS